MKISYIKARKILRLSRLPLINKFFSVSIFYTGTVEQSNFDLSPKERYDEYRSAAEEGKYWESTEYANKYHNLDILFLGFKLFSFEFYVSILDRYFGRKTDYFINPLQKMIEEGIIDGVDENSRILDVGCNSGGVLRELNKIYDCHCLGVDISEQAILAGNEWFKDNDKVVLKELDVLNYEWFKKFGKNHFSHIISTSHLIHVPNGDRKTKYILELNRIGKNLLFIEKMDTPFESSKKRSFIEDYCHKYGMNIYKEIDKIIFEPPSKNSFLTRKILKKTGIFYKRN